jgi:hypothetical protein
MSFILFLIFVAAAAWVVWMGYKNGWDWRKAAAAIAAAIAAAAAWGSEYVSSWFSGGAAG